MGKKSWLLFKKIKIEIFFLKTNKILLWGDAHGSLWFQFFISYSIKIKYYNFRLKKLVKTRICLHFSSVNAELWRVFKNSWKLRICLHFSSVTLRFDKFFFPFLIFSILFISSKNNVFKNKRSVFYTQNDFWIEQILATFSRKRNTLYLLINSVAKRMWMNAITNQVL